MPWHWEPMKDVVNCEKLRGVANEHRSGDIRMEQSVMEMLIYHILNK